MIEDTVPIDVRDAIAFRVYMAARALRVHFGRLAEKAGIDLTQEQWFVLNKLRHQDGCAQGELSDAIFADRANIARHIKSLVDKGWVARRDHPVDARKKLVYLTREGRGVHDRFAKDVVRPAREAFAGLFSPEDVAATRRVLTALETLAETTEQT